METQTEYVPFATMQTRLGQVKLADIVIRAEIQRRLDLSKVNRIKREFKPWALGVFHVWDDNGTLYVIDAQHRTVAAQDIGGIDLVDAKIYWGINKAEAIELFLALNAASIPKRIEKFLLLIEAGDTQYLEMRDILQEFGYDIDRTSTETRTSAAGAIERIYFGDRRSTEATHPEVLRTSIKVIAEAWQHRHVIPAEIIEGIGHFFHRYGSEANYGRLIEKLTRYGPPQAVYGEAKGYRANMGGTLPLNVARLLRWEYNKGLRVNLLPEW